MLCQYATSVHSGQEKGGPDLHLAVLSIHARMMHTHTATQSVNKGLPNSVGVYCLQSLLELLARYLRSARKAELGERRIGIETLPFANIAARRLAFGVDFSLAVITIVFSTTSAGPGTGRLLCVFGSGGLVGPFSSFKLGYSGEPRRVCQAVPALRRYQDLEELRGNGFALRAVVVKQYGRQRAARVQIRHKGKDRTARYQRPLPRGTDGRPAIA